MQIDLDNINFYQPPSPSPARATSASAWKRYEPPPLPRLLQYPASSLHPPTAAAIPILTERQKDVQQAQVPQKEHCDSQAAPPRNAFDAELEAAFASDESQFRSGAVDYDDKIRSECALNLDPINTEPANPANDAGSEKAGNQCTTEQHALENQSAQETHPSKEADCLLDLGVVPAGSGSVYSGGLPGNAPYVERRSATASDHFGGNTHSLVLSAVSNDGPRCDSAVLMETDWCQDMITDDAATERAATRYRETGGSAGEEVTEQRVEANGPVSGLGYRDLVEEIGRSVDNCRPTTLSSNQSLLPARPAEVTSQHPRSLRHRHERSGSRTQSSSVAVVIPARRSHRLMARRFDSSKGYGRRGTGKRDDDPTVHNRTTDQSPISTSGHAKGYERPRKRRRRTSQSKGTACNNPKLAGHTARRLTGASQESPNLDPVAIPNETKEIFGRGILRVQSHGPRNAYFITFLPDAAHCDPTLLSPETPRRSSLSSNVDSRGLSKPRQSAHRASNKRIHRSSVTDIGDKGVPLARPRPGNNKRSRVASRKGMPWSREEDDLLKTLRKDRNLPWSEVARCFTKHFPGRSQGSIQVYWSTHK